MTVVAAPYGVHKVAAQANKVRILVGEVQANRVDIVAHEDAMLLDRLRALVVVIRLRHVVNRPEEDEDPTHNQKFLSKMLHTLSSKESTEGPMKISADRWQDLKPNKPALARQCSHLS